MGLCLQTIDGDGPKFNQMDKRISTGWIWLVVRRDPVPREDGQGHNWHIQGVASKESLAVEMCADENYFIGPVPIDSALPHERLEWAGSYCPLMQTPSKE